MVAYVLNEHLQHVRTIRVWRGDFRKTPPFDIGDDTLFVGYSCWAEMTLLPDIRLEISKAYLRPSHQLISPPATIFLPYNPDEVRKGERKRLSDACRAYGIAGWENIDKPASQKRSAKAVGANTGAKLSSLIVRKTSKNLRSCCAQCCAASGRRFPPARIQHVLHWSNYSAKSVALIQARGMPIDMCSLEPGARDKAAVIQYLLRRFDPSYGTEYPIYSPEGEWSLRPF